MRDDRPYAQYLFPGETVDRIVPGLRRPPSKAEMDAVCRWREGETGVRFTAVDVPDRVTLIIRNPVPFVAANRELRLVAVNGEPLAQAA